MLANSSFSAPAHLGGSLGHNNAVETLLDDVSKQMAASNLTRRYSRGSTGQRGGSMRVVKATASANISPRNSTMLNRRKTLMADGPYRRRAVMVDQGGMTSGVSSGSYEGVQTQFLANRPVSWHSSSQMAPQPSHLSLTAYPVSRHELNGGFSTYELPPTPAAYSGYASPASTFSPLSQPFTDYGQEAFQCTEDSFFHTTFDTSANFLFPYQPSTVAQQIDTESFSNTDNMDPSMYSHFDWDNFATHGFDAGTDPPTPENFLPIQRPDPSFEAEEAIPYHPLEDPEPGEVLVGMGLYDTPEKAPDSDPQLDNYRALMMSQLLGSPCWKHEPPSTGKGLKLEETWNPPGSNDVEEDDEGDDDDDDEDDAEGSVAEENTEEASGIPAADNSTATYNADNGLAMYNNPGFVDAGNGQEYGCDGWL